MKDSVFTKIIKGEIPCHKVYEDDAVLAFLDIHPIQPGHILVVPKQQIDQFDELSEKTYQTVFKVVKQLARRVKQVTGKKRACLRIEGFDVPHAHVHIYPCNNPQDFYGSPDRQSQEPDHQALAAMAERLRAAASV